MAYGTWQIVEQAAGVVVILLVLVAVFLTVLYARAGIGLFAYKIGKLVWALFRAAAKTSEGIILCVSSGYTKSEWKEQ